MEKTAQGNSGICVETNLVRTRHFRWNRPLAKLGKAVKIADASSQRKAERETVSAVAIAFEVHNTAPGVHSGTLGIAAGMYSVR